MSMLRKILLVSAICSLVFCNCIYLAYAEEASDGEFRIRETVNVNEYYYGKLVADGRDLVIGDSPGSNARYAFSVPASGLVDVEIEIYPEEGTDRYLTDVYLEDAEGNQLTGEYRYDEMETDDGTIHYRYSLERTRVSTGKCYLVLDNNAKLNGHSVAYWFRIGYTDESNNPYVEKEFNNTRATANSIDFDQYYTGNSNYKDYDYFRFYVQNNQKVKINLKCAENTDNYLDILDENGEVLLTSKYHRFDSLIEEDDNGNRWNKQWQTYTFSPGTYYVRVLGDSVYDEYGKGISDRWKNHQDYHFTLEKLKNQIKLSAPRFRSLYRINKRSVALNWSKVKNADGYKVYRATSKRGKYKVVKSIYNKSTVRWSNKNLATGRRYYYKVKAFANVDGKLKYGNFSRVRSVKL